LTVLKNIFILINNSSFLFSTCNVPQKHKNVQRKTQAPKASVLLL